MTIRVMLGVSTSMVRSALLAALSDCEDIEVVDNGAAGTDSNVDVLVLQQRSMRDFPAALERVRQGSPLGVVAIDEDGEAGDLYRIYRTGWQFAAGGGNGLADAIRVVASVG